jgi:hypothetical protein
MIKVIGIEHNKFNLLFNTITVLNWNWFYLINKHR